MNFAEEIQKSEFDFIRQNEHCGENLCLVTVGGSYAYDTNNDKSDIDLRCVATRTKREILTSNDFEVVTDDNTDTSVYSFDKMVKLLCICNPNIIEILGLREEHYIYKNKLGELLLQNKQIFLSKVAAYSFAGYAHSQLVRLENKAARETTQSRTEENILRSIECAGVDFERKYQGVTSDMIYLYLDDTTRKDFEKEIYMDISMKHYPLRDFKGMIADMHNIVKSYDSIGDRNKIAIAHEKLGKHMCHLLRLYLMAYDILMFGEVNTYREKEHDLLMSVRNGEWLDETRKPIPEFYKLKDDLWERVQYATEHTVLPPKPDYDKVNDLVEMVNEEVVKR